MKGIRETSSIKGDAHVTLTKYKDLHNVSHYHSDHELIFVNEGGAAVEAGDTVIHLESGQAAFVRGRTVHNIRAELGAVITVLKADIAYFGNLFSSKRLASPYLTATEGIAEALKEIEQELKNGDCYSAAMSDCKAYELFIAMLRSEHTEEADTAASHKLSATEIYATLSRKILTEYATVTFDEAARYVHFSRPYFSKAFNSIFGMTFTRYLNTVRVAAAIEKLRGENFSITEVAASCGFGTIRSFNRVFKELTGYSPSTLPDSYVFLYSISDANGVDPTLKCTEILK